MRYTLFPAQTGDIETVFRLNRELIDKYENVGAIDYQAVLRQVRSGIERNIYNYMRIMCAEKNAGFVLIEKYPDRTELDDLFLFPEFQNKGIGTALIQDVLNSSDKPVFLFVFIGNVGAVRLYKRLEFEVVETVHGTRYRMRYDKHRHKRGDNNGV